MPEQMILTIVARKPVADAEEGKRIYEWVKERLSERPEVELSGHVTNHFTLEGPES